MIWHGKEHTSEVYDMIFRWCEPGQWPDLCLCVRLLDRVKAIIKCVKKIRHPHLEFSEYGLRRTLIYLIVGLVLCTTFTFPIHRLAFFCADYLSLSSKSDYLSGIRPHLCFISFSNHHNVNGNLIWSLGSLHSSGELCIVSRSRGNEKVGKGIKKYSKYNWKIDKIPFIAHKVLMRLYVLN